MNTIDLLFVITRVGCFFYSQYANLSSTQDMFISICDSVFVLLLISAVP